MNRKKYRVTLMPAEREQLEQMTHKGRSAAERVTRARILLKADQAPGGPAWTDGRIARALDVARTTVERARQAFVDKGLEAAVGPRRPHRQYPRKLDGQAEAHLIALVCSNPPAGHKRWALRLLAGQMVQLGYVESLCHETVRQTLKKTRSSRGRSAVGAFQPPARSL